MRKKFDCWSKAKSRKTQWGWTQCSSSLVWGQGGSAVCRWVGVCSVCTQACPSTASRTLWSLAFLTPGSWREYVRFHLLSDTELMATETWSLTFSLRPYTVLQAQYRRLNKKNSKNKYFWGGLSVWECDAQSAQMHTKKAKTDHQLKYCAKNHFMSH